MALTTTQVNQAFLATLGRPAEGSAATWGSTSLSLGALSDSIFIAENTEDFVESLYTEILGRASDAEGKAFWNSLLATTSKEAVLAQFKAAVIAAGQADPSNADYQSFIAQNKAFVATLYANLLGRDDAKTADAEGIDFWANALATGMSRGDLISAFVSAALSDPNSDDAQTLNAKLSVADAYSAAFNDFGKDVTADEKKAAYAQLVEQMKEVVAGSTVEEFQDAINQFKGQNQDRKTDVFTKGEDDLDASESTAATTFRGTINISNPDKSTIESGDAATGNSEYAAANTLIVDVKSDGKEKDFNFGTETAGVKVSNVNNLTINNGTADVTLELTGGDNYTGKVAIAGKGDRADVTVAQDVASLNVSTSGAKKAYADTTVAANATLGAFEGSAAKDTLTISGNIAKSINTGDGKDEVTLDTNAKVFEKATISLGGGDDTLTISTDDIGKKDADGTAIDPDKLKASVTIDGGAGTKDKLVLNSDISAGVNAITGVEFIDSTSGAISAAAADGLKTTVSGGLTINANYKEVKSINLKDIKSFKNDSKADTGSLTVQNVTYENITLSSNIKENIVVTAHTAADPKNYAEINKFGEGDTIKVGGILSGDATQVDNKTLDLTRYADVKSTLSDKTTGDVVAINDVNGKKAYIWQVLDSNDARLVAIVDKKLKVDGTSFVYDNSKTTPEEQGSLSSIYYVSGSTTLDIDKGIYGEGTATQQFNSPANKKDVLEVALRKVDGNAPGALTVTDSGNNQGTVKVYIMDKGTGNINLTGVNGEIYLGAKSGIINLDASNYTFTGVGTVKAITSGELTVTADQFTNNKTLDLSEVGANVIVKDLAVTADVNLGASIVSGDASDKVAIKIASVGSSGKTVTATTAADTITLASGASSKVTIDLGVDTSADTLVHLATTLTGLKGDTITNFKSQDKIDLKALQLGASLTTKAATADGHVNFEDGSLYTVAINKEAASIAVNTDIVASGKVFNEASSGVAANAKGLLVVKTTETSGNKWQVYAIKNNGDTTLATSEVKLVATLDGDFTASNYVGA
ncbi:DUF4214 domain-containing protein [Campylobacter sp.]|uniref:DUF4214 domain-containing protein n=1 Tax=Campylobacter sp. TaxID=205 RepID=UPI002AA8BD15|nr:DUF4214 domain-containing protein [Campylobacter sp.]MCI7447362.1 DUF4214 domain-containing protein [Campylobacter sp.]